MESSVGLQLMKSEESLICLKVVGFELIILSAPEQLFLAHSLFYTTAKSIYQVQTVIGKPLGMG